MKKNYVSMIAALLCVALTSLSYAASEPIGLLAAGNVSEAELREVQAHMHLYLPVPIEILEPRSPLGAETLEEEAEALVELREGRLGVVGIVSAAEAVPTFGVFLPGDRTAVINETAIGQEAEKRLARFKKEAMRCAGLILGLTPGPDTRCAMWHYPDLAGLDHKGGNFSPPLLVELMRMYPDWEPAFMVREEPWHEDSEETAEVAAEEEEAEEPAGAPEVEEGIEPPALPEEAAPMVL